MLYKNLIVLAFLVVLSEGVPRVLLCDHFVEGDTDLSGDEEFIVTIPANDIASAWVCGENDDLSYTFSSPAESLTCNNGECSNCEEDVQPEKYRFYENGAADTQVTVTVSGAGSYKLYFACFNDAGDSDYVTDTDTDPDYPEVNDCLDINYSFVNQYNCAAGLDISGLTPEQVTAVCGELFVWLGNSCDAPDECPALDMTAVQQALLDACLSGGSEAEDAVVVTGSFTLGGLSLAEAESKKDDIKQAIANLMNPPISPLLVTVVFVEVNKQSGVEAQYSITVPAGVQSEASNLESAEAIGAAVAAVGVEAEILNVAVDATPSPTSSPSPSASASPSHTASISSGATPSNSPAASPTASPSPEEGADGASSLGLFFALVVSVAMAVF